MSNVLEVLAATAWFWTFSVGFIAAAAVSLATLFCPSIWWAVILYAIWIWYDRKTCERGGRPITWIRQLMWWRYVKYYFNHKLITDDIILDPKKNYIFGCFPHGIFPLGPFASFVDGYQAYFPRHQPYTTALSMQFWVPFTRELFLAVGSVSVSAPSIRYLLNKEKGGNIVSLLIGGGDEAKFSKPGSYKIILNKRKGFVKMALQTGASLVPVITFGETDIYDQLKLPGLDFFRGLFKGLLDIGLVIPKGKCFVFPNRVPVVTAVGKPIDVTKTENPSDEEINSLHQQFVDGLKALFEEKKHRYVKDPENTFLEIVN